MLVSAIAAPRARQAPPAFVRYARRVQAHPPQVVLQHRSPLEPTPPERYRPVAGVHRFALVHGRFARLTERPADGDTAQ